LVKKIQIQGKLVVEIDVEGPGRDLRFGDDVVDGRGLKSVVGKQFLAGPDDLVEGFLTDPGPRKPVFRFVHDGTSLVSLYTMSCLISTSFSLKSHMITAGFLDMNLFSCFCISREPNHSSFSFFSSLKALDFSINVR
jgi:hypothetical protein